MADATLADVLGKVTSLTGVKIEIPPSATAERMPAIKLGPGPARQVLASLLRDWDLDYLILASDTDPDRIQSVMIMPRDKRSAAEALNRPPRSPFVRAIEPSAPETPALQENTAAEVSPVTPQPEPDPPAPPPPSEPRIPFQSGQSNVPKTAPVPPPASLDQTSIQQQLQQMYQQRVQLTQQERLTGPPPAAPAR